jgi:hypothetical protein
MFVDAWISFVLRWGPGPSVDHDMLNHITSLRPENVTFKNYVIECLLPFVAGAHRVVCQLNPLAYTAGCETG